MLAQSLFRPITVRTIVATATVALCACSSSEPQPQDPTGPEVFENASASLREPDINASLGGGRATVTFPITKKSKGRLEGTLRVKLIDVSATDEPVLATASVDFSQSSDMQTHAVMLDGLALDLERAKTSAIVIDWSASLSSGLLRGKRSLYAALGRLEVQVRGATEIAEGGSGPLRVIVRNPDSLAPIANAEVVATLTIEGQAGQPVFTGRTDGRGEALTRVSLPAGAEDGELRVDVRHSNAHAWVTSRLRTVRERRVYLSSDKTIYKPGQQVNLRSLSLNSSSKAPIANQAIVFEALDGKGNKVFKKSKTTDQYGVAALAVPIDTRVNEGEWTFRAEIEGARAQRKIPVTRYNLPKMTVVVSAERTFVMPGQTVAGSVQARYLFGRAVSDANVTVTARSSTGQVFDTVTGRADVDGKFAYSIDVPANAGGGALDEGGVALAIDAEVADSANQRETGALAMPLVSAPLIVRAIAEAGDLVPGAQNIVYFTVTDPVGRPIVANLDVRVGSASQTLATGADGVAELRFEAASDASKVDIRVTARDGANRTHSRDLSLTPAATAPILLRTNKAVYKADETATITVIAQSSRVYLDVYKGAQGMQNLVVDLTNGRAQVNLPITAEMRGGLLLDAFALAGSGQVVRGAQRVLVDPEDRLEIRMTTDRETFSPGDEASLSVRILDADGNPKPAALGLSVVDEAVFALGGEPDDDVRTFFNLDPTIIGGDVRVLGKGAADLFSTEGAERERLARLLFASSRTAAAPGIDFNSIREELPEVKKALQSKIKRDATVMLKTVAPLVQNGTLERDETERYVAERARRLVDAFGRVYRVEVPEGRWTLNMISSGPDETVGTDDDVEQRISYSWVLWGDPSDVDADGDWANDDIALGGAGGAPQAGQAPENAPAPAPNERATTGGGGPSAVKVRSDFRETIYVNPTLITDATGAASIRFPLADSITSWRVSAQASSADGKLGSNRLGFTTFQEFFVDFDVPTNLTAGDEIELPAIVYNYLADPQTVTVTLDNASWLDILSSPTQTVTLAPSEVAAVTFRVRATTAGDHTLTLRGTAGAIGDALVRAAHVTPDGEPVDESVSDKLNGRVEHTITVPANAVANGTRVTVTLTPGFAAEAVGGTETMLKEPNGCFEQTTSTAWPNTLVVNYLTVTGQMTPELEETSHALVTRGYQRLLTFESPTGGFNWWGDSDPGNRVLSAIMLWHLKDMESIIEIDEAVRDRTLAWLVDQQQADGHWASGDALHSGNEVLGENDLRSTAFVTWALAHTGWANDSVARASSWIQTNQADATDLYTIALAANAMAIADPNASATSALIGRLDDLKEPAGEGKMKWPTTSPSWTGAGGETAAIETTGLVAYGLLKARAFPDNAAGAVRFIVANKDAVGTWYNTQATMNALRALLAAASPTGSDATGNFSVTVNGTAMPAVAVTRENGDVYQTVDITEHVRAGNNTVALEMNGTGEISYRLTRRSYVPRTAQPAAGPFELTVEHDTTEATVGQTVSTRVVATYTGQGQRDQVMVRVGRAPGFVPNGEDLAALVAQGLVSRFEVRETDVTFYLMGLQANQPRELAIRFTPTLALIADAPGSSIYAYYEPALEAKVPPVEFTIRN